MQFLIRSVMLMCVIPFGAIIAAVAVLAVILPSLGVGSYEENRSIYIAAFLLIVMGTFGAFWLYIRSWKRPGAPSAPGPSTSSGRGLVWGLVGILVALVGAPSAYMALRSSGDHMDFKRRPEHVAFQAANYLLDGRSQGIAHGNSPLAQKLAESLSTSLTEARKLGIESRGDGPVTSLSFPTYCLLTDENCVFMVHVPELRHFSPEARDFITEIAWAEAMEITSPHKAGLQNLAVGIRGVLQYDRVAAANLTASENPASLKPGYVKGDSQCRTFLQGFFTGSSPSTATSPR